jgi:hypothetical protein
MATIAALDVLLRLNSEGFARAVDDVSSRMKSMGKQMEDVGRTMSTTITAPLVGVGTAAVAASETVSNALRTIRAGTGATGDDLKGLEGVFRNLAGQVPASMEQIATAVSDLNTRTGATGQTLEELAETHLRLAAITGEDLGAQIRTTTRLFADFGVATEDQAGALDTLFRVSQSTGIEVGRLSDTTTNYGVQLRQLGLGLEESVSLLGAWEKEGVATEKILAGLSTGTRNLAERASESGTTVSAEFLKIRDAIKNSSEAQAIQIAQSVFGARAATDLAEVIRSGRFEFEDYAKALDNSTDTILGVSKETESLGQQFGQLGQQVALAIEPIGVALVGAIQSAMPIIEGMISVIGTLANLFVSLPEPVQGVIIVLAGLLAAAGPVILILGKIFTAVSVLAPVFAVAGGAIAAIVSGPFLAIIGTAALVVAAIVAIYHTAKLIWQFKDEIIAAFSSVINFFAGPVIKGIEMVTNGFKWMYDRVVGNSYVPDMIDEIEFQFSRLEQVMVQPALISTGQVTAAFGNMAGQVVSAVSRISGSLSGDLAAKFKAMETGISWTAWREVTPTDGVIAPPPPRKPSAPSKSNLAAQFMKTNPNSQDQATIDYYAELDRKANERREKEYQEALEKYESFSPATTGGGFNPLAPMSQASAPVYNIQVSNITLPDVKDPKAFFDQLIEEASRRARAGGGNPFVNLMEA